MRLRLPEPAELGHKATNQDLLGRLSLAASSLGELLVIFDSLRRGQSQATIVAAGEPAGPVFVVGCIVTRRLSPPSMAIRYPLLSRRSLSAHLAALAHRPHPWPSHAAPIVIAAFT